MLTNSIFILGCLLLINAVNAPINLGIGILVVALAVDVVYGVSRRDTRGGK
jgi:hypothetical protein